ncbi:unnamed protein product [Closterium sp. NIES-54]
MAPGQQASAKGMAEEGAEDKGEADLAATTSMEAAGVADMAVTTRATDAVADGSMASATIVTRADICGAIATSSLMDGPLLKAKRVEEQEEGEEEAVEAVAVADMTPRADLLTELEPSPVKHVTSALGLRAEVKGMGKAMFKGTDGKMVGLKNVLWVPKLAANLFSVRRLQKAGMDTSSKGAKTYTARLGEQILWDLHEDKDVYNEMWQIPVVPMPKERQVAASISTKGEATGSGDGANGHAKEIKSKKCNLGGTNKLGEHEESDAAAKKQHKDEENPKAAAEEEYGENMWGTIASAAFSNPTSATGECDWLTLHRRMGHVALPILQQLVKNEMVAGIRVKGEPNETITSGIIVVLLCSWVNMEAEGSAPAGPSCSGGVIGAGEAGRGVAGGSAPIAFVSSPAKDDVKAFNLEKFSGEDWASWSFRMELLCNHYGLLEVMDGELKRPASEGAAKEWDRRSKDGFFLLSQCLSSNQLHHVKHLIKDIQCGPKAWKILKDVHAPSSEAMVVVLEQQLHAVKINEGDAVQGAFDQLRDLYVKLSATGVDYPKKIKCYKALSLLPESWGPLVVNLNGMKDSWSLEWIRAQVLQEEFRRKELTAAAGEGGGSAYGMKGFKVHGSKKGKAKEGSGGEQYSRGKRSNKGGKRCGGKCWYCHVEGHPWFKCRKLPDGWRPGQPSIEGFKGVHGAMGEGMGSEEGDGGAGGHGGMFFHVGEACSEDMVVPASKVALHRSSHWVIDTGAFMTMTN